MVSTVLIDALSQHNLSLSSKDTCRCVTSLITTTCSLQRNSLTLLHSERRKLYTAVAILTTIGLHNIIENFFNPIAFRKAKIVFLCAIGLKEINEYGLKSNNSYY